MQTPQSLSAIQQALRAGTLSCADLVEHYLDRIEASRPLNIYIEVFAEEARQKALELDKRLTEGQPAGRLAGMVISLKDVICYKDHLVTAGSHILSGYRSLFSSTAVTRILAEDAIIIGRVNCDEFAMGSTTETSYYGPTRNAADPEYVPGGSSGGSAVAVQAGTCLASLGSDTGGSVRQPAAFCGVIGLKPTYGRISRHGLLAYGSSFDQIGILSHNVRDAALLLEIMAGPDDYDGTASRKPVPAYTEQLSFGRPARLAYFREAMEHPGLDPGIKAACEAWIEQEVDILIPAALENQITSENVQQIHPRVKLVAEAANGPTTPEADPVINERGIFVIPDFLANAGGVTCSYFEQVQSNMNYYWEKDEVLARLDVKMTAAYHDVSSLAKKSRQNTRDAAYMIAVSRVAQACKDRGWV